LELERRFPTPDDAPVGAPKVARAGKSDLVEELTDAVLQRLITHPEQLALMRGLGLRPSICAPIKHGGAVIGALTMVTAESTRRYDEVDLQLVESLGAAIGEAWARQSSRCRLTATWGARSRSRQGLADGCRRRVRLPGVAAA
jgi:GAF domain-containing protein